MSTTAQKKLYIKTWGCQMNVYDSNRMADILSPLGYNVTDAPDDADMIILNTCHIREKATDKVFSDLGRLKPFKDEKEANGRKVLIAVAGCVAQAEGDFILQRAPYVDMVFGPQTYHELPEMVAKATGAFGKNRIVNTEFPAKSKFDFLPEEHVNQGAAAFLSIQEGCDKFCTFCVVPYTRGSEYSRKVSKITDEAKRLVEAGAKEITLLGQNVNAFHGEDDAGILKAMNRKHTAEHYLDIIERLRKARPDIAFSSDFIVGFPGESDQDFEDTMQLVRDVNFASCYSFKYSARPGTPAANMQGLIHDKISSGRLARLQGLLNEQQAAFNAQGVGTTMGVLLDRKGKREGQLQGRSPFNQSVYVTANERLLNEIVQVKITEGFDKSLTGDIVISESVLGETILKAS